MLTKLSLLLCIACAIVLVGCAKSETNSNSATTGNANKAASTTTPASTTATTASADKIGVPECDQFIADYEACVSSKVPEAARAQFKTGMEQWRSSWKKLAANPQTKGTLANVCKQTIESARTSMKAYNCTF
jgi:hypothetical protein